MKRLSFPKSKRLVSNKQFKAVLDRNMKAYDGLLTVFVAENDCEYSRLGVSVSKGCGNAVVRNRFKRLCREAFRQSQEQLPRGFDYLVMVSQQWSKSYKLSAISCQLVKDSIFALADKAVGRVGQK